MISTTSLAENVYELKLEKKYMERQFCTLLESDCCGVMLSLIHPLHTMREYRTYIPAKNRLVRQEKQTIGFNN